MELVNFDNTDIRTIESSGQTWYSVVDIIDALVGSKDPGAYWRQLKKKLRDEGNETVNNFHTFKMEAADGKMRNTDCLTRESVLRLIQSISSPKVEPFKQWLASAGEQNIQETENPELLFDKLIDSYKNKGRDDEWIRLRLRSLSIRNELTDTWKGRGVRGSDYALLTDDINKGTFGLTTGEHKAYKGLDKKGNLRDSMSNLELIFLSLGEELTRTLAERFDAQGFDKNRVAAIEGGRQAGGSRQRLEKQLGIKVVNENNLLD